MSKIVIGIPTFKDLPFEFVRSLIELVNYTSLYHEVNVAWSVRTHRNLAREDLMETAMELKADFLFLTDDDMIFERDAIVRLAKHNVPVVSGLAFTRNKPFLPVILRVENKVDMKTGVYHEDYKTRTDYPIDELVEVPATGFACCLIKKEVIEKVGIKDSCMAREGESEDIAWMRKAGLADFPIYVDTSVKVGHIMAERRIITEQDYDRNNPFPTS